MIKQYKKFGKIDFSTTERGAYHHFKDWIGGPTVQQLCRENFQTGSIHNLPSSSKRKMEARLA